MKEICDNCFNDKCEMRKVNHYIPRLTCTYFKGQIQIHKYMTTPNTIKSVIE